jgi:hypothetical protein
VVNGGQFEEGEHLRVARLEFVHPLRVLLESG